MRLIKVREILAYVFVSILAVGLAFALSLKVLKSASSQETPAEEQSQEAPPAEGAPSEEPPPPPEQAPPPPAAQSEAEPPPPQEETPIPPIEGTVVERAEELPQFPVDSAVGTARSIEVFLEPFIYDEKDRRDPFVPLAVGGPQDSGGELLTPLQRFSLDELRLIGVMWDVRHPKAMFSDPSGQVHVLGPDESIGNRNGYVATIREGEVVVVEADRTEAGLDYSTRVLKLSR